MSDDFPIEFAWPDISPYAAGNIGIPYVWTFDSGKPGRHVMVNAVTHGNELCGAVAVDLLLKLRIRPKQGKLTLAFANYEAYNRFDPADPWVTRQIDENFNRVWVEERLDGDEDTLELRRAREMRPIFDQVDDLLDIHSMSTNSPPLTLYWGNEKEKQAYLRTGYPAYGIGGPVHDAGKRIIDRVGESPSVTHGLMSPLRRALLPGKARRPADRRPPPPFFCSRASGARSLGLFWYRSIPVIDVSYS